jgi:hypothetical protein
MAPDSSNKLLPNVERRGHPHGSKSKVTKPDIATSPETQADTIKKAQVIANLTKQVLALEVESPSVVLNPEDQLEKDTSNVLEGKEEPQTLTKFKIFKELPPEIRAIIWYVKFSAYLLYR